MCFVVRYVLLNWVWRGGAVREGCLEARKDNLGAGGCSSMVGIFDTLDPISSITKKKKKKKKELIIRTEGKS
jgi:hypothetical protein